MVGVGLIKLNNVIQFLIIERQLIKYGQLVEIPNESTGNMWTLGDQMNVKSKASKPGIDYHAVTFENRFINLDTVIAPLGNIVTGVRFALIDGVLSIQTRVNGFNYETGAIDPDYVWLSSNATERKPLELDRPDWPLRTLRKSIRNDEENLVAKFIPTDLVKDGAQHVVPFIDSLIVEPKYYAPLAGLGLYYKDQPGYGGFIAPQIVTYDFEPYITAPEEF